MHAHCHTCSAQNNDLSQVIYGPTLAYDQANFNLVGQIYCTFPMGKLFCNDVPTLNK